MPNLCARLVDSLLRFLAPSSCSACGEPSSEPVFCAACGTPRAARTTSIDDVPLFVAGEYAPPLSDAIRRFKFEGHPELARPLSSLVFPVLSELELEPRDVFSPVPLHRARLVERGFNQSALLARALARHTRARFAPLLLERRRQTDQQARLARAERSENAAGAFVLRRPSNGGRVVLVDDVVTTGATARACLATLRGAGIEALAVVALAHVSGRSC